MRPEIYKKYKDSLSEIRANAHREPDCCELVITKRHYKTMLDALKIQIPREPILKRDSFPLSQYMCPACGMRLVGNGTMMRTSGLVTHCVYCGQAVDWRQNNETN